MISRVYSNGVLKYSTFDEQEDFSNINFTNFSFGRCTFLNVNFKNAILTGANFTCARFINCNFGNSNFEDANFSTIREDIWKILDFAPNEIVGLIIALDEGRVDGYYYTGKCACLIGTIANVRAKNNNNHSDVELSNIGINLDGNRPAERWFLGIRRGHTPQNSRISALTVKWIWEWVVDRGAGMISASDFEIISHIKDARGLENALCGIMV